MSFKKYIYTKKQTISRYLALTMARKRAFTALQLLIKTLIANKHLPEKLVALEVFGFIGTSTALDYAHLTDYIELWEIDPYYAKQAQKIIPKAKVMCGDSVKALAEGKILRRDYNFIMIDPNVSTTESNSFENFGVFENALNYLDKKAVVTVTIYNNLENFAKIYNRTVADYSEEWIKVRKEFYGIENVINASGTDYLKAYEKIIERAGFKLVQSNFISRNDAVGFGVFVIEKK